MSDKAKYWVTTSSVLALIAAAAYLLPARDLATELIGSIRAYGAIAPVVYFFIFVAAAVTGLPRTAVTILAGVVFEPHVAFLVVVASSMASFMLTFLLARRLAADWVNARLEKVPVAAGMMSAVERHGFRMLVLMRLNPFVPGIVNGYGFGMTSMKPMTYFVASVVGSLPLILIYVYLGWAGGETLLHEGVAAGDMPDGLLLFGVTLSAVMLLVIAWYGRKLTISLEA